MTDMSSRIESSSAVLRAEFRKRGRWWVVRVEWRRCCGPPCLVCSPAQPRRYFQCARVCRPVWPFGGGKDSAQPLVEEADQMQFASAELHLRAAGLLPLPLPSPRNVGQPIHNCDCYSNSLPFRITFLFLTLWYIVLLAMRRPAGRSDLSPMRRELSCL